MQMKANHTWAMGLLSLLILILSGCGGGGGGSSTTSRTAPDPAPVQIADDEAFGIAVDGSGNIVIAGTTLRSLGTNINKGVKDIFVAKYNSAGTLQWIQQPGTSGYDEAFAIAVDGDGNVYITGYTSGTLVPGQRIDGQDIFVLKYSNGGALLLQKQLGTSGNDRAYGIAVDGGNIYIAGVTTGNFGGIVKNDSSEDLFVAKYDKDMNQQWVKQLNSGDHEQALAIALDGSGNAFVAGYTKGILEPGGTNPGGPTVITNGTTETANADIIVVKYDTNGNLVWIKQRGVFGSDIAYGVAVDGSNNVYATGFTSGSLGGANQGNLDIVITKYDSSGTNLWTKQAGTPGDDVAFGITAETGGNVYITGYSTGSLGGTNLGSLDIVTAKYDTNGNSLWIRQTGTSTADFGNAIARDSSNNVYATGATAGEFTGSLNQGIDAFILKYNSAGVKQ